LRWANQLQGTFVCLFEAVCFAWVEIGNKKEYLMTTEISLQKRTLGGTQIEVSPIGLGVMEFSGGRGLFGLMFPEIPQQQKNAIIEAALEGGVNWFDTAEMYGFGRSERSLARGLEAIGKADDEVVVATKWMPLLRTAGNIPSSIDKRMQALDGYTIDLYMVHQPWGFSSPEDEMDAMADLVEAGKIRSVGVSNFDAARMARAHAALSKRGLPLAVNQMQYSLLHRKIESNGVLDVARQLDITIIAYTPLGSGILTGKYHRDPSLLDQKPAWIRRSLRERLEPSRPVVEALEQIAARHAVTPAQVALNWVINFQGDRVVTIPGATREEQAEQNAGAMHFKLSEEEIALLDERSRRFL
jgi:aryl-alcohol dehydrogenase-like predicted oxidoreductase